MAIRSQFDRSVSTKRLGAVPGSNREEWATNLSTLVCAIHPVSGELADLGGGGMYFTHKLYCDVDADVLIGDRVIDGAVTYTVKSVEKYDFGRTAGNQHLRVTLLKGK